MNRNLDNTRHFAHVRHLRHHAFVIEAEAEEGIGAAQTWAERELPSFAQGYGGHSGIRTNPDMIVLRYGLLSVEDARRVSELAAGAPFAGDHKVIIITASRAYHEAQNALLKLFEEPPPNTYLFLVLPTFGGLLPTLRSRVATLDARATRRSAEISDIARIFIESTKEKRSALIKKLASGDDEEERREHRDEAIAILNGIETVVYQYRSQTSVLEHATLLSDIATLRTHLYDRSAPIKMILEHLSLVTPKNLL